MDLSKHDYADNLQMKIVSVLRTTKQCQRKCANRFASSVSKTNMCFIYAWKHETVCDITLDG